MSLVIFLKKQFNDIKYHIFVSKLIYDTKYLLCNGAKMYYDILCYSENYILYDINKLLIKMDYMLSIMSSKGKDLHDTEKEKINTFIDLFCMRKNSIFYTVFSEISKKIDYIKQSINGLYKNIRDSEMLTPLDYEYLKIPLELALKCIN
jgi:hypothetical protein